MSVQFGGELTRCKTQKLMFISHESTFDFAQSENKGQEQLTSQT